MTSERNKRLAKWCDLWAHMIDTRDFTVVPKRAKEATQLREIAAALREPVVDDEWLHITWVRQALDYDPDANIDKTKLLKEIAEMAAKENATLDQVDPPQRTTYTNNTDRDTTGAYCWNNTYPSDHAKCLYVGCSCSCHRPATPQVTPEVTPEVDALRAQIKAQQEAFLQCNRDLSDALAYRSKKIAELLAEVERLTKAEAHQRSVAHEMLRQAEQHGAENETLCKRAAHADAEVERLREELETVKRKNDLLENDIRGLEDANDSLREVGRPGAITALETENAALRAEVERMQKVIDAFQEWLYKKGSWRAVNDALIVYRCSKEKA